MKKIIVSLFAVLIFSVVSVNSASAEYYSQYDKDIEVSYEQARALADLFGLKNYELGEQTAQLSFQIQESLIAKIERITGKEIDHYYIWLTVDGKRVLGIDPPLIIPKQ